jgi:microcystin-dependent protein
MATPFMSEIKICSFNFAPQGWATCNGQFLPINQNQALFSLLGTTYGGNGQTTFALPDLRGRVPVHMGQAYVEGQTGGQEAHTVTVSEMPQHTHFMRAIDAAATTNTGTTAYLAQRAGAYAPPTNLTAMAPAEITTSGGSQPHNNVQPYLVLNFCIALVGIFPSRN